MDPQAQPTQTIPPQTQPLQPTIPDQRVNVSATVISDNTNPKSGRKIIKILFLVLVAIIILGIAGIMIFPQIIPILVVKTQFSSKQLENLSVKPQPKTFHAPTDSSQKQIYTFNKLSFLSNWKLEKEISSKNGQSHVYMFDMKRTVLLAQEPKFSDLTKQLSVEKYDKLKTILGTEMLSSEYEFFNKIMQTSDSDIHLTDKAEKIIANTLLLILKRTILLDEKVEIYSFTVNGFSGFKIHSFDTNNDRVYLFDQNNNVYSLTFVGNNITQTDVDNVIATVSIK